MLVRQPETILGYRQLEVSVTCVLRRVITVHVANIRGGSHPGRLETVLETDGIRIMEKCLRER
jgi:hypothetical protein